MKTTKNESVYTHQRCNEKLEKSSKLFTLIGLVLALFVVSILIEYETKQVEISIDQSASLNENNEFITAVFFEKEVVKRKPKQAKSDDPFVEKPVELTETPIVVSDIDKLPEIINSDKSESKDINIDSINVVDIVEPVFDDFPIDFVEEVPVFPGCSGDKNELKACFSKKVKKHVNRKFNAGLGQEVGLSSGKKRIYVLFKIDKNGEIQDVKVRAPHPSLVNEAERVVKTLPKMKPGKQGDRNVSVRYTLPISFVVE